MEKVTHLALASLLNVFIAADASTWVRDLGLKAQLGWKDRSSLRRENCLHSHPSRSFSIHHPSALVQGQWIQGSLGPAVRCAHQATPRGLPWLSQMLAHISGRSWWPSKALEWIQMGPRCPEKAKYPEWEYQASDWPSVSGRMTVRMTTFYYFYVSPAPHSCLNTQKTDSIWDSAVLKACTTPAHAIMY